MSNFRSRDNPPGFVREGVGFTVDISPNRWGHNDLRIHPEGGKIGTEGCIGLISGAEDLIRFGLMINSYLFKYGSMNLIVPGNIINLGEIKVQL